MRWRKSIFFMLLSVLLLLFTSCGGSPPAEDEAPAPPGTEEQAAEEPAEEPDAEEEAASPEAEERAETTFPRGIDFEGLQYDFEVVMEGEGIMMSGRTWITENKRKDVLSMGDMETTNIFDYEAKVLYTINPFMGNVAIVSPLEEAYEGEEEMLFAPHEFTDEEWAASSTFVGYEEVGGLNCEVWVTEYENYEITLWVHPELHIPIRYEMTGPDGSLMRYEFTNIEMGRIPDAEFELPEGLEIMDVQGLLGN